MKRKVYFILLIIISIFLVQGNVFALSNEDIHSNEVLLMNMNTDEVLFSKNTNNDAVPIASLTKLMTYAVVIDEIPDLENTKIEVPAGLVAEMKAKGASRADLIDGYQYSALDLLYGVMLPSGCDAAETLARYIGAGDSSVFVNKMNAKAQSLGMTNTIFIDSYGIGTATADNTSTEQDLYKLIKYTANLPYFRQIISTEYHNIIGTKDDQTDIDSVRNTNYLMGEYSGGAYYNPYAIGGKTGNLDVAGKCLITIARKGDLEVVAITLGVPGEYGSSYDYNLTDHNILLDYAFIEHTENITIDLGAEYRSLEKGKQHKIEATTSANTTITWTSSDPSIATVDENGIVTGISQGQVKITATTSTGNVAYTYVSVDFYNGVHTKLSTGVKTENGYEVVDYSILKNKGYDYVLIRAGYGPNGKDANFLANLENALNNEMNVGIWFEGYAENKEEATDEANNLITILNSITIPNIKEKLSFPIMYSLMNNPGNNPQGLLEVIKTFNSILKSNGYKIMIEVGKTNLSKLDLSEITNEDIEIVVVYREILPDYKTTMSVNGQEAKIWNYKVNSYLDKALGTNNSLSLMYMKNQKLNTIHKVYIVDDNTDINNEETGKTEPIIEDENIVETKTTYIKTCKTRKASPLLIEDEDAKENTSKELNITRKINPSKDNKTEKEEEIIEDNNPSNGIFLIIIIASFITIGIVTFIMKNNDN